MMKKNGIQNIQKIEKNKYNIKVINILLIILAILFIFIVIGIVILININNFDANKYINKVVEIKATSNDNNDIYGSGTIIEDNGIIITSAHVVTYKEENNIIECNDIYYRLASENDFIKCHLTNYDYELDIARLQSDNNIKGFKIKNRKYDNNEEVYAIGNAMNYGISITKGIISRKEIIIEYHNNMSEFIQVDINAANGCSGGALVNKRGELIGLITFRSKDNNNYINYGYLFCVSINNIMHFLNS